MDDTICPTIKESLTTVLVLSKNGSPKKDEYWVCKNGKIVLKTKNQEEAWKKRTKINGIIITKDCIMGATK